MRNKQTFYVHHKHLNQTEGFARLGLERKVKVKLLNSIRLLCDPMDCRLPGSSVHGIFQTRVLEWVAISSPGDLPNPGIEPGSATLQADALPSEPPGKPRAWA